MNIGIIGMGYWGPNLARNFLSQPTVTGITLCDTNVKRLESISRKFPTAKIATDVRDVLKDPNIGAVAIVTPVSTHFELGMAALDAGKHVLIEKPMAASTREAEQLLDRAAKQNLLLMVDHTFLYTGAVRKIKEIVSGGELGEVFYFDSVRVNLGLFQHDVNVIWDLAPHDISIMDHVVGKKPTAVTAVGSTHFNGVEDVAYITVRFDNGLLGHFHVNWLSPVKVRMILIGGSKKMIVYDDMDPSEKVKVYDKGVEVKTQEMVYNTLIQYRVGDMYAPQLDQTEALFAMTSDFLTSIEKGRPPISEGSVGLNVVRILEVANNSLRAGGAVVKL
jgi:predicted dehydrogenase